MRRLVVPLTAIVLIAGCKGNAPAPEATTTGSTALAGTAGPSDAAVMPALIENAKANAVVPGSYANNGYVLVLDVDDSATMTDTAGKVTRGKWAWHSDGKRIVLTADGSVWAVAEGALYRMAGKDAPLSGFTTDQIWAKAR